MWFKNKILVTGLLLILSACGQKGPLLLNDAKPTKAEKPTDPVKPSATRPVAEETPEQPQKIEEQYQ